MSVLWWWQCLLKPRQRRNVVAWLYHREFMQDQCHSKSNCRMAGQLAATRITWENDSQRIQSSLIYLSVRMIWRLKLVLVERLPLPSKLDRTPIVQETLPTVEQDSETVVPYLSLLWLVVIPFERKSRQRDIELSCTVFFLGGEECSDILFYVSYFYI